MNMAFRKRTAAAPLTVEDVIRTTPKPMQLESAEMKLRDLHELRSACMVEIQALAVPLQKADGHQVSKIEKAINRLHAEREEIEERIREARHAWSELVEPWRLKVREAALPVLQADAERTLAAGEEFQAGCDRLSAAAAMFPWIMSPPLSPPPLAFWKVFLKRLIDPGCIE
jgi:hypothetical protein